MIDRKRQQQLVDAQTATWEKPGCNLGGTLKEPRRNLVDFEPTIYTMATQPLETIPEETPVPATTPARVTADPPKTKPATAKNPGRVASGKRLAKRNRLAREAKKKAEAEAAKPASTSAATPTQSEDTNTEASSRATIVTILGIGGVVVSTLGVYYQREAIRERLNPTPAPAQPEPAQPAPTPAPSRIPVKRGIREME